MWKFEREKMSKKQISNLIFDIAHADDSSGKLTDNQSVIDLFNGNVEEKYHFDNVVEAHSSYLDPIPLVEKSLGSQAVGFGKFKTGVLTPDDCRCQVSAPGILHSSPVMYLFDYSLGRLETGISSVKCLDIDTAIVFGLASIEAFVNEKGMIWNDNYPSDQVNTKICIEDKITDWIPKFTDRRFDKSGQVWKDFIFLKQHRDYQVVHQRNIAVGVEYKDVVELVNRYNFGVAGTLRELFELFEQYVPPKIIKAIHAPSVQIVQVK